MPDLRSDEEIAAAQVDDVGLGVKRTQELLQGGDIAAGDVGIVRSAAGMELVRVAGLPPNLLGVNLGEDFLRGAVLGETADVVSDFASFAIGFELTKNGAGQDGFCCPLYKGLDGRHVYPLSEQAVGVGDYITPISGELRLRFAWRGHEPEDE